MKKYQVFVSSTYQDLVEERKEVIQALLELDCIPVGMELFPATNEDQWSLIRELIDDCDYYILIIGGRYGSLNKDGISYTQMEYEYANEIGLPIISFLHKSPESIIVSKTDKNNDKAEKLDSFRELVSTRLIKKWGSPEELGSVVSRSLVKLIKNNPRIGWVKADKISSDEANIEILQLKNEISRLENEIANVSGINTEELSQGEDKVPFSYTFKTKIDGPYVKDELIISWNSIFAKTCTILLDEATENDYLIHFNKYLSFIIKKEYSNRIDISVVKDVFMSVLIQFKALGLIEKSVRKRPIKDSSTYWTLTSKGDFLMTQLRAIRKSADES